jgi:hypothetical protein
MLFVLAASLAFAGDCDPKALAASLKDASPTAMPVTFVSLAECSADEARKAAVTVIPRLVETERTPDALLAAIRLGASGPVRQWIGAQEPDVRSRALDKLGASCDQVPAVGAFFLEAVAAETERFWKERWHRGLGTCHVPEARRLLEDALDSKTVGRTGYNRSIYLSILEIYARNAGKDAIPRLADYLSTARDEEEALLLINVFPDAARVSSVGTGDPEAIAAATAALQAAAPTLKGRTLDRARASLLSMGQTEAADGMAAYRWPDRKAGDAYLYGVTVVEDITCKNQEQRTIAHAGTWKVPAATWPDTAADRLTEKVKATWRRDGAAKCKGTGSLTVEVSPEPLADAAAWRAERKEAITAAAKGKLTLVDEADGAL